MRTQFPNAVEVSAIVIGLLAMVAGIAYTLATQGSGIGPAVAVVGMMVSICGAMLWFGRGISGTGLST